MVSPHLPNSPNPSNSMPSLLNRQENTHTQGEKKKRKNTELEAYKQKIRKIKSAQTKSCETIKPH